MSYVIYFTHRNVAIDVKYVHERTSHNQFVMIIITSITLVIIIIIMIIIMITSILLVVIIFIIINNDNFHIYICIYT